LQAAEENMERNPAEASPGAEQAAEKGLIQSETAKKHPSGPKQAAEKGLVPSGFAENIPQGLKPALILRHLRHD
jgi:hypothetical protein